MLELMAFYAVRYYEEQAALLQAAVARTLTGGGRHGE